MVYVAVFAKATICPAVAARLMYEVGLSSGSRQRRAASIYRVVGT